MSGETSSSTPSSSDTSICGEMSRATSWGLLVCVPYTRGPGVPVTYRCGELTVGVIHLFVVKCLEPYHGVYWYVYRTLEVLEYLSREYGITVKQMRLK